MPEIIFFWVDALYPSLRTPVQNTSDCPSGVCVVGNNRRNLKLFVQKCSFGFCLFASGFRISARFLANELTNAVLGNMYCLL